MRSAEIHGLAASSSEAPSLQAPPGEALSPGRRSPARPPCFAARYCAAVSSLLLASACGEAESDALPATIEECGSSLDALLASEPRPAPRVEASYSEALAAWASPDGACGFGVFGGQCADGKRVLYRSGSFTFEIRYYEGEQLVGVVASTDAGSCPSVCPFSRFFGSLDGVRCDAPTFDALCGSDSAAAPREPSWMPFANGRAPGGCPL